MLKKLIGAAIATAITAVGVKVVKDILEADEEENAKFINLETETTVEESEPEESFEE